MPVTKFRSFQEAEEALWCFAPDKAYFQQVRQFFATASRMNQQNIRPGITKYRSLDEMMAHARS
jgi:hypothetical protein